jgi:hypothetical protein
MLHDCWYCKLNRIILVVGMLLIAALMFGDAVYNAFQARWAIAGKELVGVAIPLLGAWVGLKLLRAIPVFFDKIWPDETKAPWDQPKSQ